MYYYFVSTLPMIHFDSIMPFSVEEFADDCGRLLSAQDARDARVALKLEEGEASSRFLGQWQDFEKTLKNEVAWMRAVAHQQNPLNVIRGERKFDGEIVQALSLAVKTENLLEAEKEIMKLQWQRLDEMSVNKNFTLDFILAYGIKLKMLERLNVFRTEEGSKELEKMMGDVASRESSFVKREE